MTPQNPGQSNRPPPNPEQTTCTLAPIATAGPDSLPPDAAHGILEVKLRKIQLAWDNAYHDTATFEGDDILRSTAPEAAHVVPPPPGAKLAAATLAFSFADAPQPASADLHPPNSIKIASPKHADRISQWLLKNHFLLAPAVTLSQLLIALALAMLPSAEDPFDDDAAHPDDDPKHSISACLAPK